MNQVVESGYFVHLVLSWQCSGAIGSVHVQDPKFDLQHCMEISPILSLPTLILNIDRTATLSMATTKTYLIHAVN